LGGVCVWRSFFFFLVCVRGFWSGVCLFFFFFFVKLLRQRSRRSALGLAIFHYLALVRAFSLVVLWLLELCFFRLPPIHRHEHAHARPFSPLFFCEYAREASGRCLFFAFETDSTRCVAFPSPLPRLRFEFLLFLFSIISKFRRAAK